MAAPLPDYMERIRAHLLAERGMGEGEATRTAIATCHVFCSSGRSPNLPVAVNAGSRAEACAAVAELQAAKAKPPAPEPSPAKEEAPVASEKAAWDGSASRFTDEQYARSAVLDRGPSVKNVKERYSLPVREPDGTLNRNGVHAAAGRIGQVNAPAAVIAAAARALVALYRQLGDTPPDGLLKLAGVAAAAGAAAKAKSEQRDLDEVVEQRSAPDTLELDGKRLRGRIPYGVESRDLGGWSEVIAPGALRDADLSDLVATVDHAGLPLGRYPSTLSLEARDDGLHWSLDLPESRADVREAVERGDLRASSWRMIVGRDRWEGNRRTVEEVRSLRDVSVVTTGAYPQAAAYAELRMAPPPARVHTEEEEMDEEQHEHEEEVEARGGESGGGLRVESRSASGGDEQNVEARVLDAMRGVPKGEARDLTSADNSAGPVTPPDLNTYMWDKLRDRAVVLATGVPVITTSNKSIKWPRLVGDTDAEFYDELEEIAESDPLFDDWEVTPKKIAALVRGSSEAFDDSSPDLLTIVRQNLETVLGLKLDRELLVGSDPKGFEGMANTPGINTMTAGATSPNYDPFVAAIGVLAGKHVPGPYAIVTHPWVATHFDLLKNSIGDTLARPQGVPAFATTTQVGQASGRSIALVYGIRQVQVVRRQDVEVLVDRSQEFTKDAVLVRGKIRATLFVPYPEAIVKITGLPAPDPATTALQSPGPEETPPKAAAKR
jgi:HK97 family phage major capsid protein/HK97 family phage prohead protease